MPRDRSKGKAKEDNTNRSSITTGSSPDMQDQRQSQGEGSSAQAVDDWSRESDPNVRRRIQNKLAQRKFRERARAEKEDRQRDMENRERASYVYTASSPSQLGSQDNPEGLPWGAFPLGLGPEESGPQDRHSSQSSAAESSPNLGQGQGSSSR
ncbi:hypothetical protein FGG08_006442 [Glutinoglossum americanum]|uniref:BZIP domain-containing protein n=1 Tax=Glutinoglossum americanum TaxID=1670608 RepID=A0A9P8L0X1_9PEZI|nr:hypothetical protein FGG08_006442 [Glutinoglossum americanum]